MSRRSERREGVEDQKKGHRPSCSLLSSSSCCRGANSPPVAFMSSWFKLRQEEDDCILYDSADLQFSITQNRNITTVIHFLQNPDLNCTCCRIHPLSVTLPALISCTLFSFSKHNFSSLHTRPYNKGIYDHIRCSTALV